MIALGRFVLTKLVMHSQEGVSRGGMVLQHTGDGGVRTSAVSAAGSYGAKFRGRYRGETQAQEGAEGKREGARTTARGIRLRVGCITIGE